MTTPAPLASDGEWEVRAVRGQDARKVYRCPGCDHEIRIGQPHVVAWPAEGGSFGRDQGDHRHWHTRAGGPGIGRRTPSERAAGTIMSACAADPRQHGPPGRPSFADADDRRRALRLVAELALPARSPAGRHRCSACIRCPRTAGSMDSHLLRKAAWRLPALAGLAVLRFNTRGTASDEGRSRGELRRRRRRAASTCAAAVEYAEFHELPVPWLVGWSFGTELILRHGCDPAVLRRGPAQPAAALFDRCRPRCLGALRAAADGASSPSSTTICGPDEASAPLRAGPAGPGRAGPRRPAPVRRPYRGRSRRGRAPSSARPSPDAIPFPANTEEIR